MSEILTEKHYGIPAWAWVLTGIGAVLGGVWLLYKYFVEPGEVILNQYKFILEDIYKETKTFLEENEAAGIYGLTPGQEAIVAAKQEAADKIRPMVEEIVLGRGQSVWVWFEAVAIAIIVALAFKVAEPYLKELIKKWRVDNPAASEKIASQYGHGHLIFELVTNDFAYAGKLAVASALHNVNIPSIYSAYTAPALYSQISFYNALIPTLIQGSLAWMAATHMLSYMTFEVSATTGIIGQVWSWWLPPVMP